MGDLRGLDDRLFVGSGDQGEERIEGDSQVVSLRNWGPAVPDLTHRHLWIMIVGAGEWAFHLSAP